MITFPLAAELRSVDNPELLTKVRVPPAPTVKSP